MGDLSDQWWRLNNLYYIRDKRGQRVLFKPNWAQKYLYNNMWFLCIILKARQLGMTTFIQLYMLDCCLFNDNQAAGVIAHNREDAEDFFDKKIKYAYDNLPEMLRDRLKATSDSAKQLAFSNGSSIRVGTSLRSGTLQYLHVSEFGKICAKYPDKAEEIISGSLNTVEAGQFVFIESTAEGAWGRFYDMCQTAMALSKELTSLDYKFFFFPWWKHPGYEMDEAIEIPDEDEVYFARLEEKEGIKLTAPQKAWYTGKKSTQRTKMTQEYPSTPQEAFQKISEHAVYGAELKAARESGRITKLPVDSTAPVHTFWDIGRSKTDATSIWFMQEIGKEHRFIDFYQNHKKKISHYSKLLQDKGYMLGTVFLPHDAEQDDYTLKDYRQRLQKLLPGVKIVIVPRISHLNLGIQMVRDDFDYYWFDEDRCSEGITALEAYRYEYDEKDATYKQPRHDWASHPADALRQKAQGFKAGLKTKEQMSERRQKRTKTKSANWVV